MKKKLFHILLVAVMSVISLNQTCMTFVRGLDVLGGWIVVQTLFLLAGYLSVGYLNFYVLLPRFLMQRRYAAYSLWLAGSVFLLTVVQTVEERALLARFGIENESYDIPFIYVNAVSAFALVFTCLSGAAMGILLRRRLEEKEHIRQLERQCMASEVEQLKAQVSPQLLFRTLHRMGEWADAGQQRQASALLMRLSSLLRYQLYDCRRELTLLGSEVKSLENYLTLAQAHRPSLQFTVSQEPRTAYVLVAPWLFVAFAQAAVEKLHETSDTKPATLHFAFTANAEGGICFRLDSPQTPLFAEIDFTKMNRRLNLLYGQRHRLTVSDKRIELTI